jgi:hypothetical protein
LGLEVGLEVEIRFDAEGFVVDGFVLFGVVFFGGEEYEFVGIAPTSGALLKLFDGLDESFPVFEQDLGKLMEILGSEWLGFDGFGVCVVDGHLKEAQDIRKSEHGFLGFALDAVDGAFDVKGDIHDKAGFFGLHKKDLLCSRMNEDGYNVFAAWSQLGKGCVTDGGVVALGDLQQNEKGVA